MSLGLPLPRGETIQSFHVDMWSGVSRGGGQPRTGMGLGSLGHDGVCMGTGSKTCLAELGRTGEESDLEGYIWDLGCI